MNVAWLLLLLLSDCILCAMFVFLCSAVLFVCHAELQLVAATMLHLLPVSELPKNLHSTIEAFYASHFNFVSTILQLNQY